MPLPANGQPWPPKNTVKDFEAIDEASAWYTGDVKQLASYYQNEATPERKRMKFFWARHQHATKPKRRLHIPLAADIAETSSDLLFSEAPTIRSDDKDTMDRLEWLTGETNYLAALNEAGEIGAALGDVFWRINWNHEEVPDAPVIDFVHADQGFPEYSWSRLTAVTFVDIVHESGSQVWRHLERHEPGKILHGLYLGNLTHLGRRIPLTEHASTMELAKSLSADGESIETGIPMLAAGYVPNRLPNRLNRKSRRGRADIQGLEGELDALDETWTSWMRDLRLAKSRIIVPKEYLQDQGDGKGALFNIDQEVYEGLRMANPDSQPLTFHQFAIRVDEHQRTARQLIEQIINSAGYSLQTFGLAPMDGATGMTATEVSAREKRSNTTQGKKARYWGPEIRAMITAWLHLGKAQGFKGFKDPEPVTVAIADGVQEDAKYRGETVGLWNAASAASLETKIRYLHPEWEDDQVLKEVQKIGEDQNFTVPDIEEPADEPVEE